MTTINVSKIYDGLKEIGLSRSQTRKLLPEWWSADIEKHPGGAAEFCLLLSRRLSLDPSALFKGEIVFKSAALGVAYKHRSGATPQILQASTGIATSLAEVVVAAMPHSYEPISSCPADFSRQATEIGKGTISLASLIDNCWLQGVPVIPIPNLPVGVRKMDGAVINVGNRPAIIISKKKSSRAWLSFILAHEIGHIACRHLEKDGSIVDVSLQEQATYESEASIDIQEREADTFALSLLGGDVVEKAIIQWPSWISPAEIALRSREAGANFGIESGHLVLRYAFMTKRWPDAITALRFLSEDGDAEIAMRIALRKNLDFDLVADDLKDHVCQITGMDFQ